MWRLRPHPEGRISSEQQMKIFIEDRKHWTLRNTQHPAFRRKRSFIFMASKRNYELVIRSCSRTQTSTCLTPEVRSDWNTSCREQMVWHEPTLPSCACMCTLHPTRKQEHYKSNSIDVNSTSKSFYCKNIYLQYKTTIHKSYVYRSQQVESNLHFVTIFHLEQHNGDSGEERLPFNRKKPSEPESGPGRRLSLPQRGNNTNTQWQVHL